jgi:hypothetical protein
MLHRPYNPNLRRPLLQYHAFPTFLMADKPPVLTAKPHLNDGLTTAADGVSWQS